MLYYVMLVSRIKTTVLTVKGSTGWKVTDCDER